jgi:hypothetical protein
MKALLLGTLILGSLNSFAGERINKIAQCGDFLLYSVTMDSTLQPCIASSLGYCYFVKKDDVSFSASVKINNKQNEAQYLSIIDGENVEILESVTRISHNHFSTRYSMNGERCTRF